MVEVYVLSESSATTEILIRLPEALVSELDGVVMQDNGSRNELIYQATKCIYANAKSTNSGIDETRLYGDGQDQFEHLF
ncbi:hypothetical protein PO124_26165 [Bacillus licheniformis]|nr:hypothetical protein [Bacillus licheniformis]